jgi:hypothetical protein
MPRQAIVLIKKSTAVPPYSTIFVKRPKTVKGPRSTALPIVGTILQGRIVLDSPDESVWHIS